jgi:hypothetical protein
MIPIQKIYNDTLKCSEISNDIIISNNEIQFIITPWLGLFKEDGYEVIITHNQITTTYIELNDDNTYHRTKLIYKFSEVIDHNSQMYKNIYEKLNPILIVIRRDNKLKDILTAR